MTKHAMDRKVSVVKMPILPSDRFNSIAIKLLMHLQNQKYLLIKNRHTLFITFHLIVLHRWCRGCFLFVCLFGFYKLKARPSTSKKTTTHFIVVSGT